MTLDHADQAILRGAADDVAPRAAATLWWYVAGLVLVGSLLLIPWTRQLPLHGDAAMYATIAKTITQTGEMTRLTFNGLPYLNKPPLFFWVMAGSYQVFGVGRAGAEIVSAAFGIANLLLLYAICRRMRFDGESSFATALVFATTPEVVHWTRGVHLESLLTFWLLLGILGAYWSLSRPAAILLLAVALAGGWMAKGPQALFAVAIAPLLWWYDGVLRERLSSRWTLAAALLVVLAVVPWTLARLNEGTGYAETYFRGQIGGVLIDSPGIRQKPLWYFGKLLASYWPWLPFALLGIVTLARRWRHDPAARVWLTYGALVLTVTTAASARLPRYLVPLYPMLAVAAGITLGSLARKRRRLLPGLLAVALVAGLLVTFFGREKSTAESNRQRGDAVEVARALPADAEVWIASDVPQEGMPGLTKVLGFYARPLLYACGARGLPAGPVPPGLRVVTLARSADQLARQTDSVIELRNGTLAVLRPQAAAREALRARVCALDEITLGW